LLVAGVASLLAASGCGSGKKTIDVSGKILYANNKPLPEGTRLHFEPAEGDRESATAVTKADGSFEVEHSRGGSGAEVGNYSIRVLPPEGFEGNFGKLVPESYIDGHVLKTEVKEGMSPLEFKVQPRKR
jgi:hypothetical protein